MNIILTIILIVLIFETTELINLDCKDEFTFTKNQKIIWSASNDTVVISEPACLDKKNRFITRECRSGNWFPPATPVCDDYRFITQCPIGFLQINNVCLHIGEPSAFKEPCRYPGIKFYDYSKIVLNGNFWMPITKIDSTFRYIAPDKRYGREFKFNPNNRTENCLILNHSIIQTTNCDSLHHHICGYKIAELSDRKFAENSTTRLELKFNKKHEKILLNVYSPESLLVNDEDDYAIYCFTDASRNELKTSVKKKLTFNSFKKKRSKFLENLLVYQISIKHDFPGQYWCEAYNLNSEISNSNIIIGYKKNKGHEYALRVVLKKACPEDHCYMISPELIYDYLEKVHFKEVFRGVDLVYRVMHIFDSNHHGDVDTILHLSTLHSTKLTVEYYKLLRLLKLLPLEIEFKYFRSGEACIPESYKNLTWKLTSMNKNTTPREFCLDNNGIPIQRKCLGDFLYGAYWSGTFASCANYTINERTKILYNLSINDGNENVTEVIKNITSTPDLSPLDIYLVANTLNNLTLQNAELTVVDNFVESIGNIQENDKETLKASQVYLNATDTILDSIDNFLKDEIFLNNNTLVVRKDKFIVHITRPFLTNISGLAIYNFIDGKFENNEITEIKINQTLNDLNRSSLELAYYIPTEVLENVILEEDYDADNLTVITTIFYNDNLFNPINPNGEDIDIQGHVISVTIPDYGMFLEEPIQILFNNRDKSNVPKCGFWEYGVNSNDGSGKWSSTGGNILDEKNDFSECAFTHLTHFALLIMSQKLTVNEFEAIEDLETYYQNSSLHNDALNIISIIGCTLSLLGILGMFVTAACFERWRQKVGTKILLQLAITIMVESIVVHLANSDYFPDNSMACSFIGMCLHYIVLSKFSWMCVSAVLQYVRFVKILTVLPTRLVLKSSLFGWVLPILPVFILACSAPHSYKAGQQKFCYPNGIGLYVSLFLPVVLIVTINLVMFILIMVNVLRSNIEGRRRKNSQRLQIYLGILLFFMLGLPWVFGIIAEMSKPSYLQLVFVYLFCLTATLEGLILFVFYVILDRDTRRLWTNKFSRFL